MQKTHCWPEGHWNWPVRVSHKHGVRCGEMIWIGGQVDMSPDGAVLNQGDLAVQTENVVKNIAAVLHGLECDLPDLVYLLCFYVNDGGGSEETFLELVADALPPRTKCAVNAIPVPALAYEGLEVEIEAYAMRRENGETIARTYACATKAAPLPEKFCHAIHCGKMIFVSGQYPFGKNGNIHAPGDAVAQTTFEMENIRALLAQFGAGFGDVVKSNRWYAGNAGVEDFEPAALECAKYYTEPGPTATGLPLPRHANDQVAIKLSCIAMLGEDGSHLPRRHVWPDSLWDWTIHLPYKHGLKCADMVFFGGQVSLDKNGVTVNPDDISKQTHQAMEHIGTILNALGADYDDMCKVGAFYFGGCGADQLHANFPIRSSYFNEPGPATTGIPLPALAYDGMVIEIDGFAMTASDT